MAFHGCPLRCRHCLNPQSLSSPERYPQYTPELLYAKVCIDELYFLATRGGVTFGGGEPALHPQFISRFREICGHEWRITIETSLNVPPENISLLLPVVDSLIIDVKTLDKDIYCLYTGTDNSRVMENLTRIAEASRQDDCIVRLPLIPGYNDETDREATRNRLSSLCFSRFDLFTYIIR